MIFQREGNLGHDFPAQEVHLPRVGGRVRGILSVSPITFGHQKHDAEITAFLKTAKKTSCLGSCSLHHPGTIPGVWQPPKPLPLNAIKFSCFKQRFGIKFIT